MTTKTTYRVRRPGESVSLPQVYDWLARLMWLLSAIATAFALFPVAGALVALFAPPAGAAVTSISAMVALAFGAGIQFALSVAERPALRGRVASPVVAVALGVDFLTNLGGAYVAGPVLTQALGWSLGGWSVLVYGAIALLLTIGPEVAWALALFETREGR